MRISASLFMLGLMLVGGQALAQSPEPANSATPNQGKKQVTITNQAVTRAATETMVPARAQAGAAVNEGAVHNLGGSAPPQDTEALVQAEIKRLQQDRDRITKTMANVGENYSKITYTPDIGNSCNGPDSTWNPHSGEIYQCTGLTTCMGRLSRWSKNRTNPCEPGVVIDSCVVSSECKLGSVCDTAQSKCIASKKS